MEKEKFLQAIRDQKELMQDDLLCILDGAEQELLDNVCQVIVDRMKILTDTIEVSNAQE